MANALWYSLNFTFNNDSVEEQDDFLDIADMCGVSLDWLGDREKVTNRPIFHLTCKDRNKMEVLLIATGLDNFIPRIRAIG